MDADERKSVIAEWQKIADHDRELRILVDYDPLIVSLNAAWRTVSDRISQPCSDASCIALETTTRQEIQDALFCARLAVARRIEAGKK